MLAASRRSPDNLPSIPPGVMDESGTINPAALNAPEYTIAPNLLSQQNPRGTKRGRSPDNYGAAGQEKEADDTPSHKRNKAVKQLESPSSLNSQMTLNQPHQPVQTPQIKTQPLPQTTPSQTSPARSTPGSASKQAVVKALPTVRDHTTDQLGIGGDEYLPRETDPEGETKVSENGHPLDERKYRCRTFQVPDRGDKLFMLATECARALGYRDSYLLFNKNRSLYKIIATQAEKDNLIHQEILPYSYRSRQIAIVTARSMYRQFGSRLVENGRRVRDDYWEAKARKQGFTEEDAAGEKRPGAAKAREAAAAEASHAALTSLPQGEIIYSNGPGLEGQPPGMHPVSLAPLPMIHLPSEDLRPSNYGNVIRPRQDVTGPPYQDRIQTSNANDILSQASHAAEYNKHLSQNRSHRARYLEDYWRKPHEQPVTQAQPEGEMASTGPPQVNSPQAVSGVNQPRGQQEALSHPSSQMMPQSYSGYPGQQNPTASPVQPMHRPMPPNQMGQNSPMPGGPAHRQTPSYSGYPGNNQKQMWPAPGPQQSPLQQSHHMSQYAHHQPHQQPHQQHQQSSMPPPQMPQQPGMSYQQMGQMGNPSFSGMNRSMYQPNPSPQQFNMQSTAGQQPGMQGWSAPGNSAQMMQDWHQRYQ